MNPTPLDDPRTRRGDSDTGQPAGEDWNWHAPIWRRVMSIWRERGFHALWEVAVKRLNEILWEHSTIIEFVTTLPSDRPIPIPETPIRLQVRRVGIHELPILRSVVPRSTYYLFERFAQQGFYCYVATIDGKVVGYNWYTDQPYRSPFTGIVFPLSPSELFIIYSHTLRPWRGRGVNMVLKAVAFRDFQRQGIRTIRTTIDQSNKPSIRNALRWGAVPCRKYHYRRWLWWRRSTSEPLEPTPELLVRLAGRVPRRYEDAISCEVRSSGGQVHDNRGS